MSLLVGAISRSRRLVRYQGDANMGFTAMIHIDDSTLTLTDVDTGAELDAVAVIPGYRPDMGKLVNMLSPDEARQLARMAGARAEGFSLAIAV